MLERMLSWKGIHLSPGSQWHLAFRHAPETWIVVLLIVPAVILFFGALYRREVMEGKPVLKMLLALLRILAVFLILFILFQPYVAVESYQTQQTKALFLIDNSQSMNIHDSYDEQDSSFRRQLVKVSALTDPDLSHYSRLDLLKQALYQGKVPEKTFPLVEQKKEGGTTSKGKKGRTLSRPLPVFFQSLGKHFQIRAYTFSEDLRSLSPENLFSVQATGRYTALGNAMRRVLSEQQGAAIAGVVIFTDGQSNAGEDPQSLVQQLANLPATPSIFTVGLGDPSEPKDLALTEVTAKEAVTVGDSVKFQGIIKNTGFTGETVTVSLRENDTTVAQKNVQLLREYNSVELSYQPAHEGKFKMTLQVPVIPGEMDEKNNVQVRSLEVLSRKLKVLYLEQYPRWEYRYLKNVLTRDPKNFEAQCYLFDAGAGFVQESSPNVDPLKNPPYYGDSQYKKALYGYDVIILGDVNPDDFVGNITGTPSPDEVMNSLVDFVKTFGGGILFIAGPHSMPSQYKGTPLESLIPVELDQPSASFSSPEQQDYDRELPFVITPEGRIHSIFTLTLDETLNKKLLGLEGSPPLLHGFYWHYPVSRAQPYAEVLAKVRDVGGQESPLVAVGRQGSGFVAFVGTDEIWRWRYLLGDKYYAPFWTQILLYLRSGKLSQRNKRFFLFLNKKEYEINDRVEVKVRAYTPDYKPMERETLKIYLTKPDKTRVAVEVPKSKEPGNYQTSFTVDQYGQYEVSIPDELLEDPSAKVEKDFKVIYQNLEWEAPRQNVKLLNDIARQTGGKYLALWDLPHLSEWLKQKEKDVATKVVETETDLWDLPVWLLLLLALVTLEWVIRKRVQLL